MRLDPRKHLDEEIRNNPFKPKPYSTPFDAPPDSPSFLPGFKEKDPDTPDLPSDFPPEADKDGDGVVGRDVNKNELKSIVDNLVENARRIDAGEITEQELINDIVNIASAGERKLKYGPLDDLSLGSIFKVISDVHSRLAATGIPSLNTQALMDDEILKAQQYGLNAEQTRLFAENVGKFFANNIIRKK